MPDGDEGSLWTSLAAFALLCHKPSIFGGALPRSPLSPPSARAIGRRELMPSRSTPSLRSPSESKFVWHVPGRDALPLRDMVEDVASPIGTSLVSRTSP